MHQVRHAVLLVVLALMTVASTASAQQQRPTALVRHEIARQTTDAELATWPHALAETQGASARRFMSVGAVIGALATAGGVALYVNASADDVLMSPFALLPAVLGGGALGAGTGYVVYRACF